MFIVTLALFFPVVCLVVCWALRRSIVNDASSAPLNRAIGAIRWLHAFPLVEPSTSTHRPMDGRASF